jgi:hypothetical protein
MDDLTQSGLGVGAFEVALSVVFERLQNLNPKPSVVFMVDHEQKELAAWLLRIASMLSLVSTRP